MKQGYTFEVCAFNIQSALSAQKAGAHRIELCSALDAGGLSPSAGLIRAAVAALSIPVNVLIRPREGDFCYSDLELSIMLDDIAYCNNAGVHGVVVGALSPSGHLDLEKLSAMQEAAGAMEIVHHRAFDFCIDPEAALEQLISLGFHRILSSGQSNSAFEGRYLLQALVNQSNGRISIMPGAGIQASNIKEIARITGAREFHFSGKKKVEPESGRLIQGLEAGYWQSEVDLIRRIIAAA